MRGDFSRETFDPAKHYSGVLMQQGRVQLDADWNEQGRIAQYRTEAAARDTVGPHGAPKEDAGGGFRIGIAPGGADLTIHPGRMYVDGVLCDLTPEETPARVTAAAEVEVERRRLDGHDLAVDHLVELVRTDAMGTSVTSASLTITAVNTSPGSPATRRLTLNGTMTGFAVGATGVRLRRHTTAGVQPDSFRPLSLSGANALAAGRYRVYLDVWERLQTYLEEPAIREDALGGPDTAARARVVWQVKLEPLIAGEPVDCAAFPPGWQPRGGPTGTLRARVEPDAGDSGPCLLPPDSGYVGLENQLYRVEVHRGGDAATAGVSSTATNAAESNVSFKWQRDNGSVAVALQSVAQTAIARDAGGRSLDDEALGLRQNDRVEATDDRLELNGEHGQLLTINGTVDPVTRSIPLSATPSGIDPADHALLRRWDGVGTIVTPGPAPNDWIDLENGVQIQFSPGRYATGDYWLIPARTATSAGVGDIEWPRNDGGEPLAMPPHGIRHHYAPLAMVTVGGNAFIDTAAERLLDCRKRFPPLTAITAEDVSFDNSACALPGVDTVQEAIDALCGRGGGDCTLVATPGPGWEAIFGQIPATAAGRRDACICLPVGEYPLDQAVVVQGLGHLTIRGSGDGTRIVSATEAALSFRQCDSIVVRDLAVESRIPAAGPGTAGDHLNGAITVRDCPDVEIEGVTAACGAGLRRSAACVTVTNGIDNPDFRREDVTGSVRVRRCDLRPGGGQVGALIVNMDRVHVEDTTVRLGTPNQPALADLMADKQFRVRLAARLVSWGERAPLAGGRALAAIRVGNVSMTMGTEAALASAWQAAIDAQPPGAIARGREARRFVERLAGRIIRLRGAGAGMAPFAAYFTALAQAYRPAGGQGIVVGGVGAGDVRVLNNTVDGMLQGIHLGFSRGDPTRKTTEGVERALIGGNTVALTLTAASIQERHGIFAGNSESLVIENNYLRVERVNKTSLPIDGIRAFGHLGPMLVVRQNHLQGFTAPGVQISGVGGVPPTSLWITTPNLARN